MGGNHLPARGLIIAVMETNSGPGTRFYDNAMPMLDELTNGRRLQRHAKLLFLNLSWYAHRHVANIFSTPGGDKFFALTWKWSN
jgi:hypothetical protein